MPNEKREQTWKSEQDISKEFFQNTNFILGTRHEMQRDDTLTSQECGPNCPQRQSSISCPYFKETVPCLVGTTVQQKVGVPDEGLGYEELKIKVITQAGRYLIGEEVIINMDNPRASYLRVLSDKRGKQVDAYASSNEGQSLFSEPQTGILLEEMVIENESNESSES